MTKPQISEHSDLIFHLEKAIENNEFEIYYQPIIHTISGSLCGFEALVRWNHPELGFLGPGQFIEALENTRQIYHLDIHVVERVCKWYREETDAGRAVVPVSVNLSRIDFESADMFDVILGLTEKYGMPKNMLNIEITESAFGSGSVMDSAIMKFRGAGYQVWMDDFGSGYSSLNALKDYAFDELKIDMCFLSDMSPRSKKIISSMISMAKDISMVTLVEGVETKEQYEFLRSIGCDRMQGFYFSKPLPYPEILYSLQANSIPFESVKDRQYYHEINRINVLSPSPFTVGYTQTDSHGGGIPLAILEKEGERLELIYRNTEMEELMGKIDAAGLDEAILGLIRHGALTADDIRTFLAEAIEQEEREITFSVNGDLCSARAKRIASNGNKHAILLSISNITQSMNIHHENLVNQSMKNIYSLYLRVSVIRPEKDEMVTIVRRDHLGIPTDVALPFEAHTQRYEDLGIHEEDRELYREFLDRKTLESRIAGSRRGFINTKIRTKDEDGKYSKKMYLATAMGNHEVLLLVRYANL